MGNSATEEYTVIWLAGAACTGCSVSVLNTVSPTIKNVLIDEVIPGKHVNLIFHPTIMAGAGEPTMAVLEEVSQQKKGGYVLVVEGAIPTAEEGIYGIIGEQGGKAISMVSKFESLSGNAM